MLKVKDSKRKKSESKSAGNSIQNISKTIIGIYHGHQKGYGFVSPLGQLTVNDKKASNDIFIPGEYNLGAMDGDKVMVQETYDYRSFNEGRRGRIVQVLERSKKQIVGTFNLANSLVTPDNKGIRPIYIPKHYHMDAKTNDKVVVDIYIYPEGRNNPKGKITKVIGNISDKGVSTQSVIIKHELSEDFPDEVLTEIAKIPDIVLPEDFINRVDLRKIKMVTIDGEDAKDHDDAVAIYMNEKGNYVLIVAIADVSHYVKKNSAIDKEALRRGTSVYLVDRVIPMLPRKLSNGICSLNAKVDRLALTCQMEFDQNCNLVEHKIYKSVVNITERMTYNDVTKILDCDDDLCEKYKDLVDSFNIMKDLALKLRKKRFLRGSLDFDSTESKITLDQNGWPINVKPYKVSISNYIIEEFMLVTNETVAEDLFWRQLPAVYRIHTNPDDMKLLSLEQFLYTIGIIKTKLDLNNQKTIQDVVKSVKGTSYQAIVSDMLIRSLAKARYSESVEPGHFGIAAKYYCHFTSPIRRYPDLFIHRLLSNSQENNYDEQSISRLKEEAIFVALQSSETEIVADEAEREDDQLAKTKYMTKHIGEIFDGVISSIRNTEFSVRLKNTIEGFVSLKDLDDDNYIYDEKKLQLIGEKTKNTYRIGDSVSVTAVLANISTSTIYFKLNSLLNENPKP